MFRFPFSSLLYNYLFERKRKQTRILVWLMYIKLML